MAEVERFRIKRPDVIHELLDDELVIVNLKSGSYFSLDRVGAVIWHCIDQQATRGEIVAALLCRYEGESESIEQAVQQLIDQLRDEKLIEPDSAPLSAAPRSDSSSTVNGRSPFVAPVLQKFTDMQELLLLDPIHEVDKSGWPSRGN
jgi:hypothetical protein